MKNFLKTLLPPEKKDKWLYFLIGVALFPIMYLLFDRTISYIMLNFFGLIICCILFIFDLVKIIRNHQKPTFYKNPAILFLCFLVAWQFLSSFFAYNKEATWFGYYEGLISEESIWQYCFYFSVTIAAIKLKRENMTYLMSIFVIVACIMIFIQFGVNNYNYGFVNRNHTGYYLCMTGSLAAGLFLFSKNKYQTVFAMFATILHFVSLLLNGSFGPVLGFIVFFVVGLIYVLIHRRDIGVRFGALLLVFVSVVAVIDYVPQIKQYKTEESTTISKVYGMGMTILNKVGIVSNDSYESTDIAPGSDGYNRLTMWKRAIDNMIEMPLFGTGVGSWRSYNPDMPNPKPHNDFLQYGSSSGVPALIFYLALIGYLFVDFKRKHKQVSDNNFIVMCAIFVYLVQSIFGNVMVMTAPVFYILLGIAISEQDGMVIFDKKTKKAS